MGLRLEITSEHRDLVGDEAVREFGDNGGTIGRSLQNDWILPDPDRFISGRHATIDYKGGIYYLLDTSSNGVYVNGDCEPIGKGNARRLFNGDQLRFGDFEVNVSIDAGESLEMSLVETDANPVVHAHSLVEQDILKTGVQLLDEEAITGDSEFQNALFGTDIDAGVARVAQARAEAIDAKPEPPASTSTKLGEPVTDEDLGARVLVDAFLDGVGIDRAELHAAADLAVAMNNAGKVLREFVEGVTRLLISRANLKSAFRLDQTTALPRYNNPLKLSTNTGDLIKQLLVGQEGEYLGPRDAVYEVCRDLLFHQEALLDAMNSAFIDFANRLDPDELEQDFNRALGSNPLTKPFRKSKYWPLYRDVYPTLTDKGTGRFPQMFTEDFVTAYEHEIAEYKRGGGSGVLKDTVVLNRGALQPANAALESADCALDFQDEVSAALAASSNDDFPADEPASSDAARLKA